MNDSAISRAIAHTHLAIVFVTTFCLVVISLLYLSLSGGLHLKKLKLGSISAEELYLKWDNALIVDIGAITLLSGDAEGKTDLDLLHRRIAQLLRHADDSWIGSLRIRQLRSGDANASLFYDPRSLGRITLHAERYSAVCTLSPVKDTRAFLIEANATSGDFNATLFAEGVLRLDSGDLYLTGDLNVSDTVLLAFGLRTDENAMHVNAYSTDKFESVAPLVQPLHLGHGTTQWIVDRAQGGPLMLHTLRTTFPWHSPEKAFDNLYGRLTFENARYRFANDPDAFEPVRAKAVEILFKDKKLNIVPQDATFYAQSGGSTWLNIDFGRQETFLNLYLNLRAALTPPLHRLIQSYGIDLPFVQTAGLTDTDLTLKVNLGTEKTDAEGHFVIDKGTVAFNGLPMELNATAFSIKGADVTIHSLTASLFDRNVTAAVTGSFNPAKKHGSLQFSVLRAQHGLGQNILHLSKETTPLQFTYLIDPRQDRLRFDASRWRYDGHILSVGAFDAPFDYGQLRISLPKTLVTLDKNVSAYVKGGIDIGAPSADLDLDLIRLKTGGIENARKHTLFHISTERNPALTTAAETYWKTGENNVTLAPVTVTRAQGKFYLAPTAVTVTKQLSGSVEGVFDPETLSTELNVSRFRFENDTLSQLFQSQERFGVYIVPIDNEYDIVIPKFNMLYSSAGAGWKLRFFSLEAFKTRSPLLKEYNLTQSSFTLWSEKGGYPVNFSGTVDYPYALTLQQNKPVSLYRFKGRYESNESIGFTINDALRVRIDASIRIRSDGIDYNLPELIRFYRDHHFESEQNATSSTVPIFIDANHTAIVVSNGRKAKADRIAVQYENDHIYSQFYKGSGGAILEVKGEKFYLYGNHLDDDFMEHFFKLSKFKGGNLDFYVIGDKNDFNGLIKIENTTMQDYVLLNNLFAFINTVPALVTFSLPSYETKGIKINSAYAELKYHDRNLTVSGIKVDSKEMDFTGQGLINYAKDTMQMELTVKIQAGENIRKIPLVGYILVGDDNSALTTVKVSGPLEDPKISNTIAKDIIIAPFNLLKRTFNAPVHFLKQLDEASSEKPTKTNGEKKITSGTPPIN